MQASAIFLGSKDSDFISVKAAPSASKKCQPLLAHNLRSKLLRSHKNNKPKLITTMGQCQSSSAVAIYGLDATTAPPCSQRIPIGMQMQSPPDSCSCSGDDCDHTDYGDGRSIPAENLTSWGAMDLQALQNIVQERTNKSSQDASLNKCGTAPGGITSWGAMDLPDLQAMIQERNNQRAVAA